MDCEHPRQRVPKFVPDYCVSGNRILPCADPACPATVPGEALRINRLHPRDIHLVFNRENASGAWQWSEPEEYR